MFEDDFPQTPGGGDMNEAMKEVADIMTRTQALVESLDDGLRNEHISLDDAEALRLEVFFRLLRAEGIVARIWKNHGASKEHAQKQADVLQKNTNEFMGFISNIIDDAKYNRSNVRPQKQSLMDRLLKEIQNR